MMRWVVLLLATAAVVEARLQTYAMQFRICAAGELPRRGEQGQWSCYTSCVTGDLYRSQPCVEQVSLTLQCPGIFRLNVFNVSDSQGFYLNSVEQCVYPLYSQCTTSQQITLCNVTSPGCLYYDTFDTSRYYTGTCVQPYGVATDNNVFRACTVEELAQACYADEQLCTYDETFNHFLFACPWARDVWTSNNTVPDGVVIGSSCSDVESETLCASDWRTRVPREPCTRKVVRFHEFRGHEYSYDLSACNRKPCTAAQQLSVCGRYVSDCSYTCPAPSTCTLNPGGCTIPSLSKPARYCTETERLLTGCVSPAAVTQECRVTCTSTDLLTGCTLESRCLWSQGYPQHDWNALHLLPNVSYVCSPQEHAAWCGDRSLQDPFRQDPYSLCRKICNAQGVCALRSPDDCNRVPCNYTSQALACSGGGGNNSRCSVRVTPDWQQSLDPYCPTQGYAGNGTYSQAYWDSWFSADAVIQCNATEFAVSCAPFQSMCRRRCPGWTPSQRQQFDAWNATQQALLADVSGCVLEQKCSLGAVAWTTFNRDGTTGNSRVRACTTNEWHGTCATTLAGCRAECNATGLACNITAICPWSFGFIPQPAIDPDPQTCTNAEAILRCGADYTSPCLKYNCTYIGYNDTHLNCAIDAASCNSRACTPAEQLQLCGYYTHDCRVKCKGSGGCSLFGGACGAVAQFPARPCNATELLDSCAAFDNDCRVQCLDTNLTWGCFKQNICPWTAGLWIDNQIEPVPFQRGLSFATAIFCGPGWETDTYNNNCELYECVNTRRLGRHDCTCHYATCYCPFRYATSDYKCSENEAQILACDAFDAVSVYSAQRYCGQFGRSCALYCTGDKTAPDCDVISPCTCLDDFSFAPLHGLPCQGYAQYCNATEWASCGLYASTCVRSSPNATSVRLTRAEDGATTCTCLAGIVPETGGATCRSTPMAVTVGVLRNCSLSEALSACGSYAASCQVHVPTGRVVPATCQCNASSVRVFADLAYTSRITPPTISCPGPWATRNCTAGEAAACEVNGTCAYNTSLGGGTQLVNRSQCFPDHFNYSCTCPPTLARRLCGPGYVSCSVLGTYNQVDGCYAFRENTATCRCDPLYNNTAARLGYPCVNSSSVLRNCSAVEYQRFCGRPLADAGDTCQLFALNDTLVNGTCSRLATMRACTAEEFNFTCPKASGSNSSAFCRAIDTPSGATVYLAENASCAQPPQAPPGYYVPPLDPPNSTGYPRECTDDEYSSECAHDMVCELVPPPPCTVNVTGYNSTAFFSIYNATLLNFTANESLAYDLLLNSSLIQDIEQRAAFLANYSALTRLLYNITLYYDATGNFSNYTEQFDPRLLRLRTLNATALPSQDQSCWSNSTNTTRCRYVHNRTALCVARAAGNYSCTCQPGFGPLNPRFYFSDSGFIKSDPRDARLGQCEGVVRDCDPGDETLVFGGRFATRCQLSCSAADRTQNCVIYNATCDPSIVPTLLPTALTTAFSPPLTANLLSAYFPLTTAQPCGAVGMLSDNASVANATLQYAGTTINLTAELRRRCGDYVDRASFLIFDCNVTHSLCEPQTRFAVYLLGCHCGAQGFAGPSLPCENDYYTRACNAREEALVPRSSFDEGCQRSYKCRRLCYPATAAGQPEVCFRHAPDPCLDSFTDKRFCSLAAARQVCGARATSCYGSCMVHSDLNLTVECHPNALVRCICDTFNTTFFTGTAGQACDRDYVVQRLASRDNITQWCGILAEAGTVRCRDVNDSRTCYQTDACVCQFDAGDGAVLGYVGYQVGANNSNATLINSATLNTTVTRRPVFAHCAYIYGVANVSVNVSTAPVVSGASLYKDRRLPRFRKAGVDDSGRNYSDAVLIDNRPALIGVSMSQQGFSCDYQQRCGTFTEATITYCDTKTRKCNVTCGCYRGATTMVGTNVPCSAFVQSCDNKQRDRCAALKGLPAGYVQSCQATCDETNTNCEPLLGTCVVAAPVVIPRYQPCADSEAALYCGREFTPDACKRKTVCTTDPPQPDCFVCNCAARNGYINDPALTYGHHCTNLVEEYLNCSVVERKACGLRGVVACRKRLVYGGHFSDLRGRQQYDDATWNKLMGDWVAGRAAPNLLSGKFGGIWVQECVCLRDLWSALDDRRVTLTQWNTTNNMRCEARLVEDYLVPRGACPFRTGDGMPCNGVGACEGRSACTAQLCQPESDPWPSDANKLMTLGQHWLFALNSSSLWIESEPSKFQSCKDSWCDGAPVTGRVSRNMFANNEWAASSKYGTLEGTPLICMSVSPTYIKERCYCQFDAFVGEWDQGPNAINADPRNCNIKNQQCTKTFPNGAATSPVFHIDAFEDYTMSGTTFAGAYARTRSPMVDSYSGGDHDDPQTEARQYPYYTYRLPDATSRKLWQNCVLRRRSKSAKNCYVDANPATPAFGPHNQLMTQYGDLAGQASAQKCMPRDESDVEYVHVCQEPPAPDFSGIRKVYNLTQTCAVPVYFTAQCTCTGSLRYGDQADFANCNCPFMQYRDVDGTCKPCTFGGRYGIDRVPTGTPRVYRGQLMGYQPCDRYQQLTGTQTLPPDTVYSNPYYSEFTTQINANASTLYYKIRHSFLDKTRDEGLVSNIPAAQPSSRQWLSGCVSGTTQLRKRASSSEHINECAAWYVRYAINGFRPLFEDYDTFRMDAALEVNQYDKLYCFTAKPVQSMFAWFGIYNEDYWQGDEATLLASLDRPFVPVFRNLPNRCTKCITLPGALEPLYGGPNCDVQKLSAVQYVGYEGLCEARGTCCGVGKQCVVPLDWDGRKGCVNGVFDFTKHRCVCDPQGWDITSAIQDDPGPSGYCQFNACARDPKLAVLDKQFGQSQDICNGRGVCLGAYSGLCRCTNSDWGGRSCQLNRFTSCPGGNPQKRVECSGHGTCIMDAAANRAYCECRNETGAGGYWSGSACEIPHTPDDDTCKLNGGITAVHPTRDVPYCACPTLSGVVAKGGQFCEYDRCPRANGKQCNGQGVCVVNGTNAAGFPSFACRSPMSITKLCALNDDQCRATTAAPPVCNDNLDYNGCACEQPIRALCAPSSDAPLCSSTGGPIDQLGSCQVLTNLADGSVKASCVCAPGITGVYCQKSVCGDCGTGTCNIATSQCVCRSSDSTTNGLWIGPSCNISVTDACGYAIAPGGDLYVCANHGQCVSIGLGQYGCACDARHSGAKCEISECPAPCDTRSDCKLPVSGGTQKECICRFPLVWARNATYPNLCNVDQCKLQNPRTRPNANGTACECIEPGLSLASGCQQALCPADPTTGDMCGPPNPGACPEGECISVDCKISYDYGVSPLTGTFVLIGDSRRRKLCDRYQKQCVNGTCACGLGYSQNRVTGRCTRICSPENTLAIVPCLDIRDPLCIDARFNPSLTGFDNAFKCKCQPAFTGSALCDTPRCMHGGTINSDLATCSCKFPWTGDTCTDDLCVNGVANFVTNKCDCLFGWTGTRCDQTVCQNGGVPNYVTQSCKCPAKWGGSNCSELACRTNNFWDDTLKACVCQPGFMGPLCDQLKCANNKNVDASGACVCANKGQTNQYMDPLCTYRWCGPGSRVCIGGNCFCVCDDRKGSYRDPVTGNCTIPICGFQATFDLGTGACVCIPGFTKDLSVPLQPCVRDCGPYGTYNAASGACVCQPTYFGTNCEFSTVAFLQPVISKPVTLPNGIVVEPLVEPTPEQRIALPTPSAQVQVVLVDPLPWSISYQEDAERAIRQTIQGYETLYVDVVDAVLDQGGLPLSTDPGAVVIGDVVLESPQLDTSLSTAASALQTTMITATAIMGALTVVFVLLALRYNVLM